MTSCTLLYVLLFTIILSYISCFKRTLIKMEDVNNDRYVEAKSRYFRMHLLHQMVIRSLNDQSKRSMYVTNYKESSKYNLRHLIAMSYASVNIQDDPDLKNTFGMKYIDNFVEDIQQEIKEIHDMQAVESNFKDFCLQILKYYGQPFDVNDVSREISKLQITISQTKENNELLSITTKAKGQQQHKILKHHLYAYFSCINVAIKALKAVQDVAERDYIPVYYILTINAVFIKSEILRLELLCDTYNKDTILALKIIQHKLQLTKENLDAILEEKQRKLQSYVMMEDPAFDDILDEYKICATSIQHETWVMENMNTPTTNIQEETFPINQDKKLAVEEDESNSASSNDKNLLLSGKSNSLTTSQNEKRSPRSHESTSSKNEKQLPEGIKDSTTIGTQHELWPTEEVNESSFSTPAFSHNSST